MSAPVKKWLVRAGLFVLLAGLLGWALRNAPLTEIGQTVGRLQPTQIALLAGLNLLIYLFVALRWWIIVRAGVRGIPFIPLLGARLAVFGVSYFTLGPQVGGEALQVLVLRRRYGLSYAHATSSVLMDKLLEFLVNFLLLAFGLTAVFQAGFLSGNPVRTAVSLVVLLALVAWPPLHIFMMTRRFLPLTALADKLPWAKRGRFARFTRFLRAAEWLAGRFCRTNPGALWGSLGVSVLAGAGMLAEYALILDFLGLRLPFWNLVAGWTAGWLSFLVPLPGGLGALEASQVFALGMFGAPAALAISLTLLMRARDLVLGGLGLLLAWAGFAE